MKRILSVYLIAVVIILSLTGCSNSRKETANNPNYDTVDPKVLESLEKYHSEEAEKQRKIDAKNTIQNVNVFSTVSISTKRYNKFLGIEKDTYYINGFGVIVSQITEFSQPVKNKRIVLTTYRNVAERYDKYKYQEYTLSDCSGNSYTATLINQSPDLNLAVFSYEYRSSQYDSYIKPISMAEKNPITGEEVIYMSKDRGIEFIECQSYEMQVWNPKSGITKFKIKAGNVKFDKDKGGLLFDSYGRDMVGLCTIGIDNDGIVCAVPIEDILNYLKALGYKS